MVGMTPFIANTDRMWFEYLSTRATGGRVDEVNFWLPKSTREMKRMQPGEPIFFRLKKPDYCIAGYGFFAHFRVVTVEQAWEIFGWRNGDSTRIGFLQRLSGYRNEDLSILENRRKPMGATILREAHFWPEHRWIPWHRTRGWAPNIVQGKTEIDPRNAALLLQQIQLDAVDPPAEFTLEGFKLVENDERLRVEAPVVQREGQGTFRVRLLDAYGRCAITGERTEPVLDAAHIQPYLGPASNHIQNGLLLTKELHTLFDKGYVTITPDYQVRVSDALAEQWKNGKRYYVHDNQPLKKTPDDPWMQPSRDALAWHGEHLFIG
jgi:putative restriction endonuclease